MITSLNDEDKDININTIFCQPTAGVLNLGRVKIFKIMKVC